MCEENQETIQRWTAKRRTALALSIITGKTSTQEAARKRWLKIADIEEWREKLFAGAENALHSRPRDEEAMREDEVKKLKQKVRECT